jgi:hypothetical protein
MAVGDGVGAQGAGMGIGLGEPGQSGLGTSDSGGGDFGGFGSGAFGAISDLEAFAKAHNYGEIPDLADALASENISIAPILSQMQASFANTAQGQQQDIASKFAKALFTSLFTGMSPVTLGFNVAKASRALNKAKSEMSKTLGDDLTEQAFSDAMAGFNAEHDTNISPEGKFSEANVRKIAEGIYGFDPETATREQIDEYVVKQYYQSKNPSGSNMGRDGFQQWVNQETLNLQNPQYRANRSTEMGLPNWYKSYLSNSTNKDFLADLKEGDNMATQDEENTQEETEEATPKTWVDEAYQRVNRSGMGDQASQIDQAGYDYWTNWIEQNPSATQEDFFAAFDQAVLDYQSQNPDSKYTTYTTDFTQQPDGIDPRRNQFQWTPTGEGREQIEGHGDLLAQLTQQAQDLTGRSISATVGGQPLTVMPRSNQDQLNMIMGHLFTDRKLSELEHQFDQTIDFNKESFVNTFLEGQSRFDESLGQQQQTLAEQIRQYNTSFGENQRQFDERMDMGAYQFDVQTMPSTVDKASQLLGLGTDALNIWKTVSKLDFGSVSDFGDDLLSGLGLI